MIKFLADESIEKPIVDFLRFHGHDVFYIAEERPSLSDDKVLSMANRNKRILITNDKDFGELVFLQCKASSGVLLIRSNTEKSSVKVKIVKVVLERFGNKLKGNFVVVSDNMVRIRKLGKR